MTICMRTRDPVSGKLIVRETDFLTRFLFAVEIPWNDRDVHTYTHAGLTSGTPFFHVKHIGLGSWNGFGIFSGADPMPLAYIPSYFDVKFDGNVVTMQQVWVAGYQDNYPGPYYMHEDAHPKLTIIFGVY